MVRACIPSVMIQNNFPLAAFAVSHPRRRCCWPRPVRLAAGGFFSENEHDEKRVH
jgi:hypothetical protein